MDYWVKAIERFKEYFGKDGPKVRLVPLSVADEKLFWVAKGSHTDDLRAQMSQVSYGSFKFQIFGY